MSIAVSTVVAASPCLRRLLLAAAGLHLAAAGALAAGLFGRLAAPVWLAIVCVIAGVAVGHVALRRPTARGLDVSGLGQLRLTVYPSQADARGGMPQALAVRLLPGSTLSAVLMLLRLGTAEGRVCWLAVAPDSLPAGQYRALLVACRCIAGGADGAGKT